MSSFDSRVQAVAWQDDGVRLLDQRRLPVEVSYLHLGTVDEVATAIRDMVVRGAPAIGITAAYAVVLAARAAFKRDPDHWRDIVPADLERLAAARPTAVNLAWAIHEMNAVFARCHGDPEPQLLARAQQIHEDDIRANRTMGELGCEVIADARAVLTHCNAGALATGGYGTALGVVRSARARGALERVFVSETRPWLQGARLTAWELMQDEIPVTLIADTAASHLLGTGQVQWVIVGADRIAANGDVANKIGTCQLAIAARYHGVRFMVAAPVSTIDCAMANGAGIPIEERPEREVLACLERPSAPPDCTAWNPAFDITPAALIDVIVTESGVVEAPDREKIQALLSC
jgi:methylthioribose-1-phosphate isomerase